MHRARPDNPRALLLTARATLLPDTLAQLRDAEQRLNAGQLDRAIAAYQRALAIDAEHQGAQQQLLNTQIRKRGRDFRAQMSRGWQALDNNQFERAEQAFSEAATIDGNSPAVPQARTQLATRKANYRSSQALQTALQLEREERWQQALDIYEQMLSEDNSLTEPRVRRVNASVRATLDQRVNALLAEPLKLADSGSYQRGRQLLRDLSGIADSLASGAGNSQLRAQIDNMEEFVRKLFLLLLLLLSLLLLLLQYSGSPSWRGSCRKIRRWCSLAPTHIYIIVLYIISIYT